MDRHGDANPTLEQLDDLGDPGEFRPIQVSGEPSATQVDEGRQVPVPGSVPIPAFAASGHYSASVIAWDVDLIRRRLLACDRGEEFIRDFLIALAQGGRWS